jgi:hypothetical protein
VKQAEKVTRVTAKEERKWAFYLPDSSIEFYPNPQDAAAYFFAAASVWIRLSQIALDSRANLRYT